MNKTVVQKQILMSVILDTVLASYSNIVNALLKQ